MSVITSLLVACSEQSQPILELHGNTQGTTYTILIPDSEVTVTKSQIDSLFSAFDASLSTYIDNSVISQLNNADSSLSVNDASGLFRDCYSQSQSIYALSNGAFDPSVFPLVEGWGFMNNMETPLSQEKIDSILEFVSFEAGEHHQVSFEDQKINYTKSDRRFKLDFNAIAQGQSVDEVKKFLEQKGCENFYIEVGGEIIVKGKNADGVKWRIGVDAPDAEEGTRELENIIHITDRAVATSGNYRKFYEIDGVKYAHTLNPTTGKPVQHSLLSATVVADNCAKADAYATFFMVVGIEKALQFVADHPNENLETYLLYADEKGEIKRRMSTGFKKYLEE